MTWGIWEHPPRDLQGLVLSSSTPGSSVTPSSAVQVAGPLGTSSWLLTCSWALPLDGCYWVFFLHVPGLVGVEVGVRLEVGAPQLLGGASGKGCSDIPCLSP